jgi:nucleotide-binding universal stress UspA family protein
MSAEGSILVCNFKRLRQVNGSAGSSCRLMRQTQESPMLPGRPRNIFVPFSPDQDGQLPSSVSYAISLAGKTKAHLTFRIFGTFFEAPYSLAPAFVSSLTGPANSEEKARLEKAGKALGDLMAGTQLPYDTEALQIPLVQQVEISAFQGRLHDLTVIDSPREYFVNGRAIAEEVLFHTGRPMICVPAGVTDFAASRLLVAWDGTARAARALNDAMPLLMQADHVEIVSITNEKDLSKLVPGAEVAPQLARHGIKVEVVALDPIGKDAGTALRERATLAGIDMIVMGAFAHSRWRQMILGGVTDSMFSHAEVPVFMSH